MSQDDKMPAVVLYRRDKDWLFLIESVTNGGVIDEVRLEELEALTKNVDSISFCYIRSEYTQTAS